MSSKKERNNIKLFEGSLLQAIQQVPTQLIIKKGKRVQ
jgi:hypothetical protein